MRRALILLVGAAVLFAACAGEPRVTVNTGDGAAGGISVTGVGRVTGTPDTLSITLGVSVRRDTVGVATGDAADLASAIIAALRDNGVAEEDIQTANYSIWPEYDWRGNRQILTGYRVTNELRVKVRDVDRAGAVIDAATAAGGDDMVVSGLAFSIEDNTDMLAAARAAAWADAEAKATQLAELSGVSLGTAVSITETIAHDVPPVWLGRDAAGEAADTPIEPGQADVTVTIQVTFGL
jgi:uncharacterized protein